MKIRNMTPHVLNVEIDDLMVVDFPSEGNARLMETTQPGDPFPEVLLGPVVGLPEPEDGVYLVVSRPLAMVLAATTNRTDILVVGQLLRNPEGVIIGARGFYRLVS